MPPGTGKTQTARLWTYARDERPWGGDAPPAAWYRFSGDRRGQHPKDHLARFRAGCTPTAMPGSRISIAPAPSARSPAWPMSDASSSTSTGRRARPSPKRPSPGSPSSTPSRRRPEARRLTAARNSAAPCRHGLRRSRGLAGHAAHHDLGQIPSRRRHPLCADPHGTPASIPRQRHSGTGQQTPPKRGMRAIALGRKNYLFVGSEAGGKAAASPTP